MGLILLVPGIILLNTSGWFNDQHTVGRILTIVGAVLLAIQVLFILIAGSLVVGGARRR